MSVPRSKQTRLRRQASVLHELQETQEKDSLDGRYARLMAELAALCGDRSNVVTTESLQFFASSGRAEPVKLERQPERAESLQKPSGSSKPDDLLSADAARRQRVEELTRFFMEAKSDIEFALGGGRDFHDAKEKDKDADSERDEDRVDDKDEDEEDDTPDPERTRAKLHAKLLRDKLDNRVYNVMLGPIREQDPALYGAILCHPLVTGVDPKKDKKKKKKRKDRERKDKQPSQTNVGASMLTPDLTAELLSDDDMKLNISRFVAKSIAEGSLQGLMLAAKLVLSFLDHQNKVSDAPPPTFPLVSHLRVLRGEKAPEYRPKKTSAGAATKDVTTPTKADETMIDTSALESAEDDFESDLQSVVLEAAATAGEMDLDSDSGSIAKLRARLSRFGDDGDDGDEDDDDDDERGEGEDSLGGEGVDEDALMARAIALSLSPEVNLRDQSASGDASLNSKSESKADSTATDRQSDAPAEKTRPLKFSAEELLELGPFTLPANFVAEVDGATVVTALIVQMTKLCMEYLKSCHQGVLPNKSPVQPHPLTFMLLNSLLRDFHTSAAPHSRWAGDSNWVAKWHLFSACSMLSLFRVLEVHFFHVEVMGIAPASVGLGQIPRLNTQQNDGENEGGNPLLESLKSVVLHYIALESPPQADAEQDVIGSIIFSDLVTCSPDDVQKAAVYYCARTREQAMAAWIRAFAIFYDTQKERHMILATMLAECLKLARSGEQNVEWKFHQLDILCARLALPDMAQLFVPTCVDVTEHDSKTERGQNKQSGSDSSVKPIDDGALQNAASKTGKIKAKWSPTVIRASLDSGSLSARCLYDYISGHGPPGLLDAIMESPGDGPSADSLNADTLASAYEEMWDMGRKQKVEALECMNRLHSLVDLLRESILSSGWHDFSFKNSYELVHAPLLPLLEKEDDSRPAFLNARIVLLRSLQDLMIQRLGGSRGDEPPALEFDSSRCAETMTLSDGNRTAKQYTAKQWGMVMATTGCPPNTGIHEWGVRLDRCEKGHIFLGSYEDTKSHTSGCIVGNKMSRDAKDTGGRQWVSNQLVILEMVIANLLGYFGHVLTSLENADLLIDNVPTGVLTLNDVAKSDSSEDEDSGMSKLSSECTLDEYDEWVSSNLLEGGLPLETVQTHLKNVLERASEITGFGTAIAAGSLPVLAEASKAWLQFVLPKTLSAPIPSADSTPVTGACVTNPFLKDLIENRGDAAVLDRWVSKHVGESPFVRLGGEPMKATRRTVCAALMWHSGFLGFINKHIENSQSNFTDSDVRPHDNLMHIWRAAQRVIEWAIRAKNSMGSSYTVIAGLVIRKAQFLLEIEPSAKALAAAEAVFALTTVDSGAQRIASKSAVYECAERIYSDVLVQVARFVEAPIRVSTLQSRMLGNCTAAFLRTIGMMTFRNFVGDSGSNHRGVLTAERHEVIQSSFALSSALQWLSPTLADSKSNGSRASSLSKDFGDFGASVIPTPSSTSTNTIESSHYLSGLGGCGKHLKSDLRDSFESLYGYLSASLSRATWAHDADLQLVVLLAWGIIIQPDDHSFLSRVGIFRVLQTVLDEARGSSDATLTDESGGSSRNSPDDAVLISENKKKIVQAALKVVHLLAAQVAHASDTADGLLSASDLPSTPGLSLGSIPLLRKPSGPETLGKSVFHMLYTELKNSLEEMRQNRGNMTVEASATAFVTDPTQSGDPSTSGSEAEFGDRLNDAQEYCYQICSLLYSVSGSPVCRSHLSSSRWLRLLLALVDVNSPQIQRRILKLLRRLLPSLDPSSIRVRYDEIESFDMDSDDEYDADGQDELDHASTLVNFFVGIVGLNSPPSVAEVLLRRLTNASTGTTEGQGTGTDSGFNAGGLAAEVVLLLRSLYESDKWAEYLNRAIADALSSIPLACVTEQDRPMTDAADSDVEMEDMSQDTPSLDSWTTQTTSYVKALSALCILDGHIEGLHVGGTVKIMPRAGSSLQEIAFRGARGVIVAYEPEKSAAEVLLRGSRTEETNTQQQSSLANRSIPTRPVRVPIDDLFAVPEVELPDNAFSDAVLKSLLIERFPYFLAEVKKSLIEMDVVDALNDADEEGGNEDSEDDDDMSNDGSSSPSGMDSEMPMNSGPGVDESDSEAVSSGSPRHQKSGANPSPPTEPTDVFGEMEKESRLHRMLLCQHGLRASATLLKNDYCAATFIRGVGSSGLKDLLSVAISETPTSAGVGDISSLEESWLMLWSRWYAIRSSHAAPTAPADTKEGKSQASDAVEDENLSPGPMVQQMMEMGFPKEWCDVALTRCSQNVEAAINFCFEHSSDMERLVAEHRSSRGVSGADSISKSSRKDDIDTISPLLEQLSEMGFPFNWCKKALAANRNNVDAALTWILSNGEALEAEDRRDEEAKLRTSGGDATDGNVPSTIPESEDTIQMPNPLRAVSGQACIGEHDLMVEGLVGGGFASVGAPDCLVSSGRWYYEATLHTNGCIQIGWADVAFCGAADRGDGVGDGAHSWAYDGWRQQRWHGRSSPWGSKWKQGDVVGCGIDADAGTIIFSLNGKMRSANMGVAFRAIDFARGVYPCASFNRRERLQFNLGGTPFKYPPPPGFQPILNVLSETYDLSSVPKGFDVIGSREDCLEESIGEENYSSDTRYFARDMHPSMLRSSGHGRSSGFASGSGVTKADALAEIKALPDSRVYVELLVVTRSLAILQARRALLTLLAKWPTSEVGPFSVTAFLSDGGALRTATEDEDSARFIDFIKLIAGLSALHVSNALPSASLTLPDGDALHLLDCGATGRYALGLLSGVVQSALNSALSNITSEAYDRNSLVGTILSCISLEVKKASQRQYARIPWNSSEAAITATLLQITAETGQSWSDKEVLSHPNLFLAEWISGLLLESLEAHKNCISSPVHDQIRQQLLEAWMSSLKSPSMCVKERGATILAGILQDILPKECGIADENGIGAVDGQTKMRLEMALGALPLQRLVDLSQERVLREYPNVPVCSKYVQSLVELVSAAGLVMSAVGKSTDELFENSSSQQLQACKRIEVDLEPIDQKEYEEVMTAKKLLQAQQAQQAVEEALKQQKLEAERAAAAEAGEQRDSSSSLGDSNATVSNGDAAAQTLEEDLSAARGSGVTNMEVDNSDSEEAPDITLSAIANMVTEDSDVLAATAAIAAGVGDRLVINGPGRRTKLPMPELLQEKANPIFEFRLPEKDHVFDTSMLNTQEIDVLEAAKRGIMGEEPRGWKHGNDVGVLADSHTQVWSGTLTQFRLRQKQEESNQPELKVGCKVIRGPNWKWRDQDGGEGSVGVVEGVSPWSGVDGEGMSVRWPNDSLYTYRWGADGNFDLIHVEVDEDGNITHQHATPKVKQEDEGSFGSEIHFGVLLYLFVSDENDTATPPAGAVKVAGLMEWPDYGAAVRVVGLRYADESLCIQELQLTRGNPDMGWMLRFGSEKWQPGTKYMLRPIQPQEATPNGASPDQASMVDTLRGEYLHAAVKDGELVEIHGELQVSTKHLFTMDHYNHFSTLGISSDGLSVTCHSGESRNLALGTVGFTTGVHYWEVHVEQAEFGSVFIGVCEKAGPPGSQAALSSRLNRWHGWGFVNFRATYHNSTERIYGDHFNASDTIGVRLDMEQGKLSFFMDGIKFGEHIVSDLGVAFENMKGERNSRTLYPCIGMRKGGDRVTLNQKWISMPGVSPRQILSDAVDASKALHSWYVSIQQGKAAATTGSSASGPSSPATRGAEATATVIDSSVKLPGTLLRESWSEWKRWSDNHWQRCHVRPRGISVDFDTSPAACVRVSNAAGLGAPLLAGDRVRMCSKCGQELNQPEEAVILGVYRGFLWYRTETQGNEGADEGRAWAWYWSLSELPELLLIRRGGKDMTLIENSAMDMSDYESAPERGPFKPRSALEERARTDFNAFVELATRTHSTTSDMQLVERLNAYCAAIGLDVTNLNITDVVTPAEMEEDARSTDATSGRARTRSLVVEDYFTSPALKNISGPELRARTAVLRVLNSKILRVLPIIAIQPDDGSSTQPIEVAGDKGSISAPTRRSIDFLSMSLKLRSLRRLVFTSTKRAFWDDVLRATTTSTPLPSDEYEDPREIRVIRINRIQAQASKLSLLSQPGDRLRRSVFGQLYREMRAWSDSFFRRAYCGKGHGGQRRAFKVKFLGEGVNDYGGPYRAVFEQIVDELQMDNVELAKGEQGLLPLLIPCPNRRSGTGSNQDKFLLNPSCGTALLANGPMALDLHRFLGKLIGTAVRHGLQMGLDLPALVWRPLAGLEVSRAHLESVDVATTNNLSRVEELSTETEEAEEVLGYLTLSTTLSDGAEVLLVPQGEKMPVTLANRELYVQLVEKTRLTESSQQLAALKDGLASVLPMELAPLFTPRELEVLICGRREVDVDLLRQCTEYSEGADEAMPHVQHFWEVLREMTSEERTSFLRFVWARSRMPNSAKDFPMNFKVQAAHDPGAVGQPDLYLPHAQTCFFALRLPAYTSKETLRTKLLYAIQNSPNMDADVRLHNAEGWADA
ncbi:hypothetical protein PRIC2_003286 [Phytophthora ramorum]